MSKKSCVLSSNRSGVCISLGIDTPEPRDGFNISPKPTTPYIVVSTGLFMAHCCVFANKLAWASAGGQGGI